MASKEIQWHFKIAYDGSDYCGWQVQNTQKTVQGEMLKRLRLMLRNPELRIYGSSRTDAGVHALDQQVSFTAALPDEIAPETFASRLNRWLPDDIVIKSCRICDGPFNARYDNFGKAYTYCISPGVKVAPAMSRFVWRTPHELDVEAMRYAAALLEGKHDFASFAVNPGREIPDTVRNLYKLQVIEKDGLLYVVAVGESFLYKMVRSLTGFLVYVGFGYAKPDDAVRVLEGKNRSLAADSAPAQGLFLAKVFLSPDEWKSYSPVLPPFSELFFGVK